MDFVFDRTECWELSFFSFSQTDFQISKNDFQKHSLLGSLQLQALTTNTLQTCSVDFSVFKKMDLRVK